MHYANKDPYLFFFLVCDGFPKVFLLTVFFPALSSCTSPSSTAKFNLPDLAYNPSEAKAAGRKIDLRSDWEEVKSQIMYEIVQAKFNQNPDLKEKLLATGDEHLEEGNTWGDTTWGTVNGIGENRLARILMKVRKELQEESK